MLIDVSASQRNLLDIARSAASQFFSQVLRKKDEAFLISFGADAELLQDSTNSLRLLEKGLGELRLNTPVGGLHPGPVPTAPSNRDYQGGFATAMMLKDLKLAQDAAAKSGASTPLGAQAEAMYALFDRLGHGGRDFSAMLQLLRGRLSELENR